MVDAVSSVYGITANNFMLLADNLFYNYCYCKSIAKTTNYNNWRYETELKRGSCRNLSK